MRVRIASRARLYHCRRSTAGWCARLVSGRWRVRVSPSALGAECWCTALPCKHRAREFETPSVHEEPRTHVLVMELEDMPGSEPGAARREGSTPSEHTPCRRSSAGWSSALITRRTAVRSRPATRCNTGPRSSTEEQRSTKPSYASSNLAGGTQWSCGAAGVLAALSQRRPRVRVPSRPPHRVVAQLGKSARFGAERSRVQIPPARRCTCNTEQGRWRPAVGNRPRNPGRRQRRRFDSFIFLGNSR